MLSMLDRKLVRGLFRMWLQVLAIALVMACGVATLVIALGVLRSLDETREAFYDRYRFGTVFASLVSAPLSLREQIAKIDGVSGLELRVVRSAILDIDGMSEPATALAVSIPDAGEPQVNALYIRAGRLPDPNRVDEVAINEQFANAHHMQPGTTLRALLNGRERTLTVTAIVLSPEYVYTLGPGDLTPDAKRFGILFMPTKQVAGLYEMQGAFNDVTLRTQRGANIQAVKERLDTILKPYGGTGAHDRTTQLSNAFLDSELTQLRGMANIIPPIFLFVSAFLVNMILSRLITLEREQIGLLKALGYGSLSVGWHYAKLVLVVALLGAIIGSAVGAWAAPQLTRIYSHYYFFPFLVMRQTPDLYAIGAVITGFAALLGAGRAIWTVLALPAAVAMQPPAPIRYRKLIRPGRQNRQLFSQLTTMALRNMIRHPVRTGFTIFSTSISLSLLITGLFAFDSVSFMMETVFFHSEREDATIYFGSRSPAAMQEVERLPGVLRAEPIRSVPVVLRNGFRERELSIQGWSPGSDLSQILDTDLNPVTPPPTGLLISTHVAEVLHLRTGDLAEVELIEDNHRLVHVPVTGISQSYIGLSVYMNTTALDRLAGKGPRVNGARIALDGNQLDKLYATVKTTPAIGAIGLLTKSRENFRNSLAQNIYIETFVYAGLAVIITFGVIYNAARIQLSERARELASLRVLGFTKEEVFRVLLVELALILLLAQPLGWALGWGFCWLVVQGVVTDLFRLPFIINPSTYAYASALVLFVGLLSAWVVRRRVQRLDLIGVLKTRD